MIKKLFISLLILSALTSDGIMMFQGSFLNVYAGAGIGTGVPGESGTSVGQSEADASGGSLFGGTLSSDAFILTGASVQKLKYRNENQCLHERINHVHVPVLNYVSKPAPALAAGRETVFTRSGLSPPYREL